MRFAERLVAEVRTYPRWIVPSPVEVAPWGHEDEEEEEQEEEEELIDNGDPEPQSPLVADLAANTSGAVSTSGTTWGAYMDQMLANTVFDDEVSSDDGDADAQAYRSSHDTNLLELADGIAALQLGPEAESGPAGAARSQQEGGSVGLGGVDALEWHQEDAELADFWVSEVF